MRKLFLATIFTALLATLAFGTSACVLTTRSQGRNHARAQPRRGHGHARGRRGHPGKGHAKGHRNKRRGGHGHGGRGRR